MLLNIYINLKKKGKKTRVTKKYLQQFHNIPQFTYHPTTRPIKFCPFIVIIIIGSCCEMVGKLNVKLLWFFFFFFFVILDLHISKYVFNENPFVFRDLVSVWLTYFLPIYFTIQLIFATIHRSYCTISTNIYLYV